MADLVTQSNLFSGGMEDTHIMYLFGETTEERGEIDKIRNLEVTTNIKIFPDSF